MVIAVSYHGSTAKLQGLADAGAGPFDRPEWYALLERHGAKPFIAIASDGASSLALPLARSGRSLESLTNWFAFTWRPLGHGEAGLQAIAADLLAQADSLCLYPLPDEDGTATRLETAFRTAGWAVFREPSDENHILDVAGRSFAEYWAGRPGRMRTTLSRKAKKLDIEIHRQFDAQSWAIYRDVYERSWKPAEELADLLEDFARTEGAAQHLRLGIARADGKPVAVQFWTVDDGTAYIHKLANLDEANAISAGTVLTAALFEHVIDVDHVARVDFGTGADPYKRDWMDAVRPRYRLLCYNWRKPATWPAIGKALVRHLANRNRRG